MACIYQDISRQLHTEIKKNMGYNKLLKKCPAEIEGVSRYYMLGTDKN
jgi:hypothetical protein